MHDYSRLPTLVLNEIFGYLSLKERVKCEAVCRSWKEEIELKEKTRDSLVLHVGPYLWNMRWTHADNRGLMKFENSFEVKHLAFLQHLRTRTLPGKIKKLAIVNYHSGFPNAEIANTNVQTYIRYFVRCREIEIRDFPLRGTVTFDLPKLQTLVIRECPVHKLVLNCPLLEVLYCNWQTEEISFRNTRKLKRFFCFGWPRISLDKGKFESLEYLNLFIANSEPLSDRLLDLMPRLKRFVLNSSNLQADLENIRGQQERYGLKNLEILFFGFRDPLEIILSPDMEGVVEIDCCVEQLFDSYSKLVENSPWRVSIDYSKLFAKFKILPSSFFERFSEPYGIEITEVTSYTHLFEFLRCYPFMEQLKIDFSKVKANRILDVVQLLNPSLRELTILEEHWSRVLDIDLSFMCLFDLVCLQLKSTRLPVEFIRKVAAKRSPHFTGLTFIDFTTDHRMIIDFSSPSFTFYDFTCRSGFTPFPSLEQLIFALRSHPHLGIFLCGV